MGCLFRTIAALVLGCLLVLLIWAVFTPWSFYMGGSLHAIPGWQGWGRMHSATAGDFALYIYMYPGRPGRSGYPNLSGTATLCTPRKERFPLKLGGTILNKHVGTNLDGQPMHLYMSPRLGFFGTSPNRGRPSLDLYGEWHNPNLVMDDHGGFSREFLTDGSLNTGHEPPAKGVSHITLAPGSKSDFDAACADLKRP